MSTAKLIKQAKKFIATRDSAQATAEMANQGLRKSLREALMLVRTVGESMEIYGLTDDSEVKKTASHKAVTLLGTSAKHLWDLPLLKGKTDYSSEAEFRKKEQLILSKVTVEWLMSLEKELPHQYKSDLKRRFGEELRQRFEQEARASTSYAEYELVSEHYRNLPVDTSGAWYEDGWQPEPAPPQRTFRTSDLNNF